MKSGGLHAADPGLLHQRAQEPGKRVPRGGDACTWVMPALMHRNLLYTAITRAKRLVVLVGREDACGRMSATSRPRRATRLAERLAALLGSAPDARFPERADAFRISAGASLKQGKGEWRLIKVSVITDEIGQEFDRALDVALEHRVRHVELRALWDTNVADLTPEQVARAKELLDQRGRCGSSPSPGPSLSAI